MENGSEIEYDLSELKKSTLAKFGQSKSLTIEEELIKKEEKKLRKLQNVKNKEKNLCKKFNDYNGLFREELQKKQSIISFDLEFWEKKTSIVLEIGFTVLDTKTMKMVSKNLVITDYLDKVNGIYVPDNKYNFMFGETLFLKKKDAWELFYAQLDKADLYLGHSLHNDLAKLEKQYMHKKYYDTTKMFDYYANGFDSIVNLEKISNACELNPQYLHNAGNDAYYTMKCALAITKKIAA